MTPGMYGPPSKDLANSKWSVTHEPTIRSKAAQGTGYSGGGDSNHRGGYGMGSHGASYSKNKASTYGRGYGSSKMAGTEGRSKNKYS